MWVTPIVCINLWVISPRPTSSSTRVMSPPLGVMVKWEISTTGWDPWRESTARCWWFLETTTTGRLTGAWTVVPFQMPRRKAPTTSRRRLQTPRRLPKWDFKHLTWGVKQRNVGLIDNGEAHAHLFLFVRYLIWLVVSSITIWDEPK